MHAATAVRTKFGDRAFSHAGPTAPNTLPDDLCTVVNAAKFRKQLKEHCLRSPYGIGQTIIFSCCGMFFFFFFSFLA